MVRYVSPTLYASGRDYLAIPGDNLHGNLYNLHGCVPLTLHFHTLSLAPYALAAHAQPTYHVTTLLCPSCDAAHAHPTLIM